MAHPAHLSCSDSALTLRVPLADLDDLTRHVVTGWLRRHDIAPQAVALHRPIEREAYQGRLSWSEQRDDGTVVRRWRYVPVDDEAWPARFPAALDRHRAAPREEGELLPLSG